MKTKLLLLSIFIFQISFSQETDSDKKQAAIITKGIIDANKKEREAAEEIAKNKKLKYIISKGTTDTILDKDNYESTELYENLEHISFEVKDGLMYAKFKARLLNDINENKKIKNYKLVKSDTVHTILKGENKIIVYVTPAESGKFLSTGKWGWSFGLLTVPFKIRPATHGLPSESKADIKNINIFFGRNYNSERMFWNQRTSSHRWLFGGMAGISTETLTNLNSNEPKFENNPTNQAYLTLAGGVGYSYKDKITLMFIPVGADIGFSDTSKKWIYNGKYWWGFGIGLDISNIFHF